uniref:DNA-directed RNA polymerase n=1 Tax=Protohalopteris sp. TaxID=2843287 RepID=A0A8F0JYH6_9PHAE|nr:RNA polymerase alpha subunit [Protohalopteris sp.]
MTNLQCKCLEMNLLIGGEYYGHFLFRQLEGGEGSTLANMIRRVLLSSIVESKIIGVRFAGVSDEFSSMEGVREDLLEIMLNLKEIIIKNPSYEPCYGRIKVVGPAIVTAGSLILPPNVTVVNPRSHILTICEESLVELEVRIEPGKTYMLPQKRKTEGSGEFINVDANFTPVLKVNSFIQPLYQEIDPLSQNIKSSREELHIEIYTNGAILPHQALMIAGNKLASMILAFQNIIFPEKFEAKTEIGIQKRKKKLIEKKALAKELKEKKIKEEFAKELTGIIQEDSQTKFYAPIPTKEENLIKRYEKEKTIPKSIKRKRKEKNLETQKSGSKTLADLGLSQRIVKILKKSNILTINDLLKISTYEPSPLETIKGLGVISIAEITEKLALLRKNKIK